MRILFMGSAKIACPSLDAILESGDDEICAVATQPDRPQGRGRGVSPCAVRAHLLDRVPILTPDNINSPQSIADVAALEPDLAVVVAYGQIFKPEILSIPKLGFMNIHTSLLPAYRGPAPIEWSIANGDRETGVTTMWVVQAMDEGDILLQQKVTIDDDDTGGTLHDKLAASGASLLLRTLDLVRDGRITSVPQDDKAATYAPKLKKSDGRIDWSMSAKQICDRIRAFNPRPGCYCGLPDQSLKVFSARIEPAEVGAPGDVLAWDGDGPVVRAADAAVRLTTVQPQGKKPMGGDAYMRGRDRIARFE